jgi:hypothetical protein
MIGISFKRWVSRCTRNFICDRLFYIKNKNWLWTPFISIRLRYRRRILFYKNYCTVPEKYDYPLKGK